MPLSLLKYGLSDEYPVEVDLPPPKELKSPTIYRNITASVMLRYWKNHIWAAVIRHVIRQ